MSDLIKSCPGQICFACVGSQSVSICFHCCWARTSTGKVGNGTGPLEVAERGRGSLIMTDARSLTQACSCEPPPSSPAPCLADYHAQPEEHSLGIDSSGSAVANWRIYGSSSAPPRCSTISNQSHYSPQEVALKLPPPHQATIPPDSISHRSETGKTCVVQVAPDSLIALVVMLKMDLWCYY
ncbi:hypothetical protein NQZ68_005692 [Dissostichus eleginoides]|nr:hypothetical protein NQZ68_005692 [Dissostichus eleginoides]